VFADEEAGRCREQRVEPTALPISRRLWRNNHGGPNLRRMRRPAAKLVAVADEFLCLDHAIE
jgi:hypothetical protein